jgi:hypothetical protein
MLDLLRRRKIAYYTETTYTDKSDFADDVMKEFVDEQLVNPVLYDDTGTPDTDRSISAYLSISADLSDGPTISRRATWSEYLLTTCQRISEASREAGNEVFFGIRPNNIAQNSIDWIFVTNTGQPGADLTSGSNQVVFSQERKNMKNPRYREDWADSANFIYGAGPGQASARIIETAEDTVRSKAGIFARREGYAEARNQKADSTAVQDNANSELEARRPLREFRSETVDVAGSRFGVDWDLGDKVIAEYLDFRFKAIIRNAQITYTSGTGEQVAARLDWKNS